MAYYYHTLNHHSDLVPESEILIKKVVRDLEKDAMNHYYDLLQLMKGPNVEHARLSLNAAGADNAQESIWALTPMSIRTLYSDIMDDGDPPRNPPADWPQWLDRCWSGSDPWLILMSIDAAYRTHVPQPEKLVERITDFGDSMSMHMMQLLTPKQAGQKMLTTLEQIKFLSSAPLFEALPLDDIQRISEVCEQVEMLQNEVLFQESDPGDALYLIVEGQISVLAGGREVACLGPGECIGEIALLDDEPRSASASAKKDSLLLRINRHDFDDIVEERTSVARGIFKVLSKRLREANQAQTAAKTEKVESASSDSK